MECFISPLTCMCGLSCVHKCTGSFVYEEDWVFFFCGKRVYVDAHDCNFEVEQTAVDPPDH